MVLAPDHVAFADFLKPRWGEVARYKPRASALMSHNSVMRIRRFFYLSSTSYTIRRARIAGRIRNQRSKNLDKTGILGALDVVDGSSLQLRTCYCTLGKE
jgi:hypothetical protein